MRFSVPYVYCWACVASERERISCCSQRREYIQFSLEKKREECRENLIPEKKRVSLCVRAVFFPPWERDLQISVLLFLVKRRRVWGFVVDRFPFAEGLGVKRKDRKRICFFQVWEFRFGEEAVFLPVLIVLLYILELLCLDIRSRGSGRVEDKLVEAS